MANSFKPVPLNIILIESALETINIPQKKKSHKKNHRKDLMRAQDRILDVSIHNHLMQNMSDKNKRGRPDIIHSALLLALDSRLNHEGQLQIFIHTINNEIIVFDTEVRLPRNYNRFIGLMEQLFQFKKIPPNDIQTLISITSLKLVDLLNELYPDKIILFSEMGRSTDNEKLQRIFSENERIVIFIGGFPHGDFSKEIVDLADEVISIYEKPLTTLTVLSTIINTAELNLLNK